VHLAALGLSAVAAWRVLSARGRLRAGETVLVLGAGGAVGTVAVQAAKLLGAGRVVAAGRAGARLERALERGADAVVAIDEEDDLPAALRAAADGKLDVVIDTLWGAPARAAIEAAGRGARHVQVGQLAGVELTLPAPAVRSVSLDLRGFSVAHPPPEVRREGYATLSRHVADGDIVVDVEALPLAQVDTAWERQRGAEGGAKLVLVP
jgi:NADPH:quinone reductase-like Zn-dependent oxidoreductase